MTGARIIASTDGVRIPVHDLGGTGPTLLLAHATGFHGRVWGPCADHLRDFHCLAPDLRGHGDAVVPEEVDLAWGGFAEDLLAVIDALDLARDAGLVAAGHSKGGAALLMAEQRRPGTFRALYLYEPVVPPFEITTLIGGPNPLAEGAARRRPVFDSYEAAYDNYRSKPPLAGLDPAALRAYVDFGFAQQDDGTVRIKCRPETEAAVFRMGFFNDAFAHLDKVTCPVTVATGRYAQGEMSPAGFAPVVADALPDGRLVSHPDLGHFGPLEAPATIAADIRHALT